MEFNLLFGMVSALTFSIQFIVNQDEQQDYFIFNGENSTVILYLAKDHNFTIHQSNILSKLSFDWKGFKVNNVSMSLTQSNGDIHNPMYNTFTFLSPMMSEPILDCSTQPVVNLKTINYGYIIAIVSLVAVIFDLKPIVVKRIRDLLLNGNIYEAMQRRSADEHQNKQPGDKNESLGNTVP